MLLTNQADRDMFSIGIDDCRPEERLEHENTLGMVTQCPVAGIGEYGF